MYLTNVKSQWNGSMNERAMKGSLWHCTCHLRGKGDTRSQISYISIYIIYIDILYHHCLNLCIPLTHFPKLYLVHLNKCSKIF